MAITGERSCLDATISRYVDQRVSVSQFFSIILTPFDVEKSEVFNFRIFRGFFIPSEHSVFATEVISVCNRGVKCFLRYLGKSGHPVEEAEIDIDIRLDSKLTSRSGSANILSVRIF